MRKIITIILAAIVAVAASAVTPLPDQGVYRIQNVYSGTWVKLQHNYLADITALTYEEASPLLVWYGERDENGELLPDEVRLTKFGRLLRSSSIDELPELFNIVKGDMALIGPRPLLVKYLPRYNSHQSRRHEVRQGLTGLAQVHGRNAISWEEKFDWDVKYVDNITFSGDCRILVDTFKTVLHREGISSGTSDTMEEFLGTNAERKI